MQQLNHYEVTWGASAPQVTEVTVLMGEDIRKNVPPALLAQVEAPAILLQGTTNTGKHVSILLDWRILSMGLLIVGGIGKGKTVQLFKILAQLLAQMSLLPDDSFFIFDPKGDYAERFYDPNDPHHILIGDPARYPKGVKWNLFAEIAENGLANIGAPGYREIEQENLRQITEDLFQDMENKENPFFDNAAKTLFLIAAVHLIDKSRKSGDQRMLCNSFLRQFILTQDPEGWKRVLSESSLDIAAGAFAYFGGSMGDMAASVLATLNTAVSRLFAASSPFGSGGPDDRFAIRDAVRQGGKVIFVEYNMALGQVMAPMYKMLLNRAIQTRVGMGRQGKGNLWLLIDEMKLLPKVKLDDCVNLCRSLGKNQRDQDVGIRTICACQNVVQIENAWETKEQAHAILGGFGSVICFGNTESNSLEWASSRFGKNYQALLYSPAGNHATPIHREGHVAEPWDLQGLPPGKAVVYLANQKPFYIQFDR
jgi:hypothetical protein